MRQPTSDAIPDSIRNYVVCALNGWLGIVAHEDVTLSSMQQQQLFDLCLSTKTAGLLEHGASRAMLRQYDSLYDRLRPIKNMIVARNMASLNQTIKVCNLLRDAEIEAVAMKGPARIFQLYGVWDARPSTDADVLVRREDYRRAGKILCSHGFRRGIREDSKWWHEWLGESPFLPQANGATVDLHHRVQQPGAPAPIGIETFFTHAESFAVGNQTVPILSKNHSLLLAFIGCSKAMRSREPWLSYAHEAHLALAGMSQIQQNEFREMTGRLGLSTMIANLQRKIAMLFANDGPSQALTSLHRDVWINASGYSSKTDANFYRTRLQWSWTEGCGPSKLMNFTRDYGRWLASERSRIRETGKDGRSDLALAVHSP